MGRSIDITFAPLTQWPAQRARTPDAEREHARFKTPSRVENGGSPSYRYVPQQHMPVSRTFDDLDRELAHIEASSVVVQLDATDWNLRNDGRIRADAKVRSPAIVLSFQRGRVPYVFATDHFKRWEDNLRAIVLGLEALRKLERYHIAQAGDQYRGWNAIPATTSTALSTEQAAEVIARRSDDFDRDDILNVRVAARDAYRSAAARAHPDRGGTVHDFQLIQEAKRVLEAHHGGAF